MQQQQTTATPAAEKRAKRNDRAVAQAAGQAILDAVVFDRLEDRQMMAAHVAGSPASYSTIQAAVNAAPAGGTVTVDGGTYTETVTVNKQLTIDGIEAGVDARGNARQSAGVETIVTGATTSAGVGASFYVAANDVTLDGFTVQGETSQDLMVGAGIVIAPNVSGTHVVNDVVQNDVAGLFLANASGTDAAVIRHDVFRNNNNAGVNGGRGIYTDQSVSGGLLTDVTIDGNTFTNDRGGNGTTGLEAAVALESGSNAQSQTNVTITNNVFDSDGKAVLAFNLTGLTFAGNTVTRGLDWYSGIVRFEGNDHNVTVTGNNLYANTGPAIAIDTKGFPGDDGGFTIAGNNIYGNGTTSGGHFGVTVNGNVYDGPLNLANNFWGTATGPGGDGPGTGDTVYDTGHVVSGQSWSVTADASYASGTSLDASAAKFSTTPVTAQETPFWGVAAVDGAPVQAEDFDEGGQGFGSNTTTTTNAGGQYRSTGVGIQATTDAGGGYNVGWTAAGEWLDYAVNLTQGGTYRADLRLATPSAGATVRLLVDGVQVGTDAAVPNTGGFQTWQTASLSGLQLTAGPHTVRIVFVTNAANAQGPNFNWFQLTNTAPVTAPTAPTGLTAAANGGTEVDLAWTNTASAATGVTLQRSTDGVTFTNLIGLSPTASSYADTGLSPLTTYAYRAVATNAGGASAPSNVTAATTAPAAVTNLTALAWTSATAGWSAPQANTSIKGTTITLRGKTYPTGIGTHASSTVTYNLAGKFGTFATDVGIDDETAGQGAADFQVYGDGTLLYDSGVLTGASPVAHVSVNVSGVRTLTLVASPGVAGTIDYDHADWAGAQLLTAAPQPVAPSAPANLTATTGSTSTIYLGWTNTATNQTAVAIDRSGDNWATSTTIATVAATATGYTDATAGPGVTYAYRVRATNAAGTSAASAAATAATLPATASVSNLSGLTPTSATVGWGTLQDDASIKGNPITVRGVVYATGLGVHASSTVTYALNGQYATFLTDAGIDDETAGQGNVDFQVYGDGKLLYDSGVLTGTSPVAHVAVGVAGVQTLTLVASPGIAGTIDYDHADWAGARLVAAAAAPAPTAAVGRVTTPTATVAPAKLTAATVKATPAASAAATKKAAAASKRAAAAARAKALALAKVRAKAVAKAAKVAEAKLNALASKVGTGPVA